MNNGKTIGMALFFGGIILLIIYGIIIEFEELMNEFNPITGLLSSIIILGFFTLLVSIYLEQKKDTKETMSRIKKEDLKP